MVLHQEGESCTGHAVAATINTVLSRQAAERSPSPAGEPVHALSPRPALRRLQRRGGCRLVAPRRLQGLAPPRRRLDREWNHGRGPPKSPLNALVDLDEPDFLASCRQRPLGAYYRVNAYRLDDMQSAISELHAIAVSAAIHDGWSKPRLKSSNGGAVRRHRPRPDGEPGRRPRVRPRRLQRASASSSRTRGAPTGATTASRSCTYDDWLLSAYDAWVARPGVPNTPFARPPSSSARYDDRRGRPQRRAEPALLRNFVVNTANDGLLSERGKMTSTPPQVDGIFTNMAAKHAAWPAGQRRPRHIVLYAHGGLIDENGGLTMRSACSPSGSTTASTRSTSPGRAGRSRRSSTPSPTSHGRLPFGASASTSRSSGTASSNGSPDGSAPGSGAR